MAEIPDESNDRLSDAMVEFLRSITPEQRLKLASWATEFTRQEMRKQLRIDHPTWEKWRINRALAYWCYGDEIDAIPEDWWPRTGN